DDRDLRSPLALSQDVVAGSSAPGPAGPTSAVSPSRRRPANLQHSGLLSLWPRPARRASLAGIAGSPEPLPSRRDRLDSRLDRPVISRRTGDIGRRAVGATGGVISGG